MPEVPVGTSGSGGVAVEPASFRDPASTIFYRGGPNDVEVLRGLDATATADWQALQATSFFGRRQADGGIVATEQLEPGQLDTAERPYETVLRHERIPFVSYPYEWTFSMLQDAAILHLDLLLDALDEGMTMKDGYAFNVQWHGTRPVFIDVPSFERNPQGGPWAGYRQFCQTFLYPLLLQAHKDVPFRYWMRGSVNGLETRDVRNVMSTRDLLRAGVLKHVVLHGAMEARFTGKAQSMQTELRDAGFGNELTKATVQGLRKLVGKLRWQRSDSTWADYRRICNYTDADRGTKEAFVKQAAAETAPKLAWDLGANDGAYSRLVSEHAGHVLAVDFDELVVETLYRALRQERNTTILPLVMNLADASPGLGWRGRERKAFDQRERPDLVLALALLHHLVISAMVPLAEVLDWFHSLGARLVVEFVHPEDGMVERLLANKPAGLHDDYRVDVFEALVAERFEVERQERLPSGTRTLYFLRPRG